MAAKIYRLIFLFRICSQESMVGGNPESEERISDAMFKIGDTFSSFEALESQMKEYEKTIGTRFWRRDSRTVAAAQCRLARPLSQSLRYYELRYCCMLGGQKFKSRSTGVRKKT